MLFFVPLVGSAEPGEITVNVDETLELRDESSQEETVIDDEPSRLDIDHAAGDHSEVGPDFTDNLRKMLSQRYGTEGKTTVIIEEEPTHQIKVSPHEPVVETERNSISEDIKKPESDMFSVENVPDLKNVHDVDRIADTAEKSPEEIIENTRYGIPAFDKHKEETGNNYEQELEITSTVKTKPKLDVEIEHFEREEKSKTKEMAPEPPVEISQETTTDLEDTSNIITPSYVREVELITETKRDGFSGQETSEKENKPEILTKRFERKVDMESIFEKGQTTLEDVTISRESEKTPDEPSTSKRMGEIRIIGNETTEEFETEDHTHGKEEGEMTNLAVQTFSVDDEEDMTMKVISTSVRQVDPSTVTIKEIALEEQKIDQVNGKISTTDQVETKEAKNIDIKTNTKREQGQSTEKLISISATGGIKVDLVNDEQELIGERATIVDEVPSQLIKQRSLRELNIRTTSVTKTEDIEFETNSNSEVTDERKGMDEQDGTKTVTVNKRPSIQREPITIYTPYKPEGITIELVEELPEPVKPVKYEGTVEIVDTPGYLKKHTIHTTVDPSEITITKTAAIEKEIDQVNEEPLIDYVENTEEAIEKREERSVEIKTIAEDHQGETEREFIYPHQATGGITVDLFDHEHELVTTTTEQQMKMK